MSQYKALIVGRDGRFVRAVALDCADDDAAVEYAKQYVDGHDVEVWRHERRVAQLKSDDPE